MVERVADNRFASAPDQPSFSLAFDSAVRARPSFFEPASAAPRSEIEAPDARPLGRVIGQYGNKYIVAQSENGLVIVDQHAAHERITYERLRMHEIKIQPLLAPIVASMKPEEVAAVLEVKDEIENCGLAVDRFGDDAVAIFEKPADWDMDWTKLLRDIAAEVRGAGHSSQLQEKLHLKLANYACHHSVRAGQKLDYAQMDALLRDVENTERAGQCNHGRPVYKIIKTSELDGWFERV
jgi:DNA mismatch repair protein MutL